MKVVVARNKGIVEQLRRIADALDVIVREQYRVNMRPPTPLQSDDSSLPDIEYTDNLSTLREELQTVKRGYEVEE